MTLDRYGEPIEDDDTLDRHGDPDEISMSRTRDEIHHQHIAELRRILKDARDRREAQP